MEQMKSLLEMMEKLPSEVNVDAVFGSPQEYDGRVLIPVAEITYGYGVGFGSAEGVDTAPECTCDACDCSEVDETETQDKSGHAVGGGGGIGAKARPIAYIEVGPEGVRVNSIEDEKKIALAGILLVAWTVGWIGLVLKTIFTPRN